MTVHVVDLKTVESYDPKPVLAGPWRSIRLARLAPGEGEWLPAGPVEYAVFVVDGAGEAAVGGEAVPLRSGTSLTLMRGAGATLRAADAGLQAFVVAVDA